MTRLRKWLERIAAVVGLALLFPLSAPALTTQTAIPVTTAEQATYAYDAGSVRAVSDKTLTGSESPQQRVPSFGQVAGLDAAKSPATVDELLGMMNKRAGVDARYAAGDAEAYLKYQNAAGSHMLKEGGASDILIRKDVASRQTAFHEWLHRSLQQKAGGPTPGEDAFIEGFLERHKTLFKLEGAQ